MAFGTLLRQYRRAAELTQEVLAERSGLSVDAVSALERGARRAPRRITVDRLAAALGLTPPEREALIASAPSRAARRPPRRPASAWRSRRR